ncbi:UTP--glucose-1-phosphate uridylyltransferase GalU [Gammaproteobacteria bacterium]|nr:UTP--glucose-1-phosphate uridylyltransferase GalU [Gammaproteobacteria bacterium]
MIKIKKAVLPVAGFGTRFLPATKAIPKEMLTIIDKPLIEYAVEEAISAGAEEIIFITSHTKSAIKKHFSEAPELEKKLIDSGKIDLLKKIKPEIFANIKFTYIDQAEQKGLGHAILLAEKAVGNDAFSVLLPDDLFLSTPTCLQQILNSYSKNFQSVIAVNKIDKENIHKYGVIDPGDYELDEDNTVIVSDIVEKPDAEDAPSDIAVAGRYIFNPSIFDCIKKVEADGSGEIQITDAIKLLIQTENVQAKIFEGDKYDCGSKEGYLEATITVAMKEPGFSDKIKKIITDKS